MRRVFGGTAAAMLVAVVAIGDARAGEQDIKNECVDAHVKAQRDRLAGRIASAKRSLLTCARASCPDVVRSECLGWLPEVLSEVLTVRVQGRRGGGVVPLAALWLDGAPVLAGAPIEVDPGRRVLRGETADGSVAELVFDLLPGNPGGELVLEFPEVLEEERPVVEKRREPEERPAGVERGRRVSPWVWTLAGVGAAGGGGFTYFGLRGRSKQRELEAGCAPACGEEEVAAMRRDYLAADVSLLVGVVALAGAIVIYETSEGEGVEVGVGGGGVWGVF